MGHKVTEETFSFLLMGCIQDKKAGFLKAVQVSLALALPGARVSFVFKLYVCMQEARSGSTGAGVV